MSCLDQRIRLVGCSNTFTCPGDNNARGGGGGGGKNNKQHRH